MEALRSRRSSEFRSFSGNGALDLVRQPLEVISSYGSIEARLMDGGDEVLFLPSRSVPDRYLDRTQWDRTIAMGNMRPVATVDTLVTGENPKLVVKAGESKFTTNPRNLDTGTVWWDGPRSFDKPIRLESSLPDVQTLWEAAYLTELWSKRIPAETPQAIIVEGTGRALLVVDRIDDHMEGLFTQRKGPTHEQLMHEVTDETELLPVDATNRNVVKDAEGYLHLIDVNRWRWPPHTDEMHKTLLEEIRTKKSI